MNMPPIRSDPPGPQMDDNHGRKLAETESLSAVFNRLRHSESANNETGRWALIS